MKLLESRVPFPSLPVRAHEGGKKNVVSCCLLSNTDSPLLSAIIAVPTQSTTYLKYSDYVTQ